MDTDSPVSRVERTFWAVWYYITGAVNRFLRPEPTNIVNNEQESLQSSVHSEPVNSGLSDSDPNGQGVSEDPPVSTASLLSSSRPVIAWELCTTDVDLGPEEESLQQQQQQSQLSGGSESGTEKEIDQKGTVDSGQPACKVTRGENKEVENSEGRQSQTPGDDEYKDHEKTKSQNLTEREMSQDLGIGRMSGSAPGGSQKAMTLEDHQKVSEAMIKIQVTEEIIHVGEQDLKAEDAQIAICLMTDRNAAHEHNMHIEEVQCTLAEREVEDSDAVSRLVLNENRNNEVEKQTENQPLVCEELSEEDTYDKAGSGLSSLNSELEMTTRKSSDVSMDFGHEDIIADRSETNEVEEEGALADQRKVIETTTKIQVKDEMFSVEQVLEEAKDGEIKLCLMSDLSPADEHNMHIGEMQMTVAEREIEDSDAVSRLVSENENSNNEAEKQTENQPLVCEELAEEDTSYKAGSGLSSLNSELKVTIRKTSNVSEDFRHEDKVVDRSESDEVEEEKTQDDQEKVSETTRKIQEKEEMLSFEKAFEDVDVTLCQMTDLGPSDEHNMQVEEANVQSNVLDTEVQNSDVASQLALENKINNDEVKKQVVNQCSEISLNDQGGTGLTSLNDGFKMTIKKSANASEDAEHKYVITSRSESDEIKDERGNVNEAEVHQTTYVKQEQEKNVQFVEENNQEFVTKHVESNKEVQQRAEPQMYTAKEKEDVAKDHEVQTKTRETGIVIEKSHMTTEISVEGRVFVKDEEGMLSREEEDNNENCVDTACGIASGAVKSKGETGQEMSSEFKNTPLGIYEGQELNSPTCEETQEAVPEYNNKTVPDENTTQWFLEGGDYKEIYATVLPEEVESREPESLQNSGSGGDFSVVREHEEEQGSTGEKQTRTFQNKTIGLLEETKKHIVEPVEESGQLSEEDEVRLVQDPKTTWTEHSEEVFEIDRTATELQGRNEKLLVDSESDEGVSEIRNAAEDAQESTGAVAVVDSLVRLTDKTLKFLEFEGEETSFWQESEAAIGSEYKSIKSPALEDTAEVGVLKQSDETDSKLPEDTTVEMQAAGTGMEKTGSGDEAVDNETQNKSEMERLDVALTTKDNMSAKCETLFDLDSIPHQSVETRNPPPHEVFDTLIDTREEDDFLSTRRKPKDLTLILEEEMQKHEKEAEESRAERTHSSVSGCQNFIDEEILDLWIKAASFQDTDVAEEQETGQQMHATVETLQTEEEKDKPLESIPGKSGLVIDTETYLSTADSGLLDLSVSEWERDLRQTSSGTFQSPSDMLFTELLTPQPNYESEEETDRGQSNMIEEPIAETRFHPDSGHQSSEAGYLHQESNQSQEKIGQEGDIQSSVQKEEVKEMLDALISVESGLVSITEMSLSTGESGLLYQSVSEWERDLRETSIGSFQGPNDMLSTELSVPKPNYESQEATETGKTAMTDEEAIAEATFHMETGPHQTSEDECLHQESDQSQEKADQEGDIWSSMQTEEVKEKREELISGESGLVSAMEISSSIAESGLLYHSVSEWGAVHRDISTWSFPGTNDNLETEMSIEEPYFESQETTESGQSAMTEDNSSAEMGFHPDSRIGATEAGHQESDQSQQRQDEEGDDSAESDTGLQKEIGTDVTNVAIRTDEEKNKGEDAHLKVIVSDSSDEIKLPQSRSDSDASFQDETMLTDSQNDTCTESEEPQANTWSEDTDDSLPKLIRPETAEELESHSEFLTEINVTVLDFTAQRSRIAVKNRHVRPPQNPRSLLNMPSEDPTPAIHPPVKAPTGVPFGGMGIGIKLPGLGAGFPVLKKTRVVPEDKSSEESETKPEKSESPKPEETQHRPKWMPPSHQGFGNPLMSELKTKLRKATKE